MSFDERLRDRETQSHAATVALPRLPESWKTCCTSSGDTRSCVGDLKEHALTLGQHAERDGAAGGSELQRVPDEGPEHLRDAERITADEPFGVWIFHSERDLVRIGQWTERVFRLLNDVRDRDLFELEREPPRLQANRVEKIGNQAVHLPRGSNTSIEHPGACPVVGVQVDEELCGRADDIQRIPEVMRHNAQHLGCRLREQQRERAIRRPECRWAEEAQRERTQYLIEVEQGYGDKRVARQTPVGIRVRILRGLRRAAACGARTRSTRYREYGCKV